MITDLSRFISTTLLCTTSHAFSSLHISIKKHLKLRVQLNPRNTDIGNLNIMPYLLQKFLEVIIQHVQLQSSPHLMPFPM